jgi:uncharacterized protein
VEYRRLGRTELRVSVLGLGCGYLSMNDYQTGVRMMERAFELGINYFDGRYGDSSQKLAPLLARNRERCVIVTKTHEVTAEAALRRVDEDLAALGSDYVDIYLLRSYSLEMMHKHLAPGGSMEGLLRAKEAGKVRFVGFSGHSNLLALAEGIESGVADVVLFPLNIVYREALEQTIPVAARHDVGLAVMKPVAVGMIPPEVALPWLMNQPIHTMVPGASALEELERDVAAVERSSVSLSAEEEATVERWRRELDLQVCRICDENCQPYCEAKLNISWMIYHDVGYNHVRNMGLAAFLNYPWAPWAKARMEAQFSRQLEMTRSCTRCGECERRCPHHLPIMDLLAKRLEVYPAVIAALHETGWAEQYKDAVSPYR